MVHSVFKEEAQARTINENLERLLEISRLEEYPDYNGIETLFNEIEAITVIIQKNLKDISKT